MTEHRPRRTWTFAALAVVAITIGVAALKSIGRNRMVSACGALPAIQKLGCYQEGLRRRLKEFGTTAALATLDSLARHDADVQRDGHVYAHDIGIETFARDTVVPRALGGCTTAFSSGCYHGVIQAYLERRDVVDGPSLTALCEPYRGTSSRWLLYQCVHGTGHGLTMFFGRDLPKALGACDLLLDAWDRDSCYGGAFMENLMHATMPEHLASRLTASHRHSSGFRAIDSADALYPCTAVGARYWQACYLVQTSVILHLNGGDVADAARSCEAAAPAIRPVCFQSLGRDITSYTLRDAAASLKRCQSSPDVFRQFCYVGVAKALVDWTSRPSDGVGFCGLVKDSARAKCFHAVGEQIGNLAGSSPERERFCDLSPDSDAVQACRLGAQLR